MRCTGDALEETSLFVSNEGTRINKLFLVRKSRHKNSLVHTQKK